MSYTNGLDNPELYMQVKLYTGDGSTPSITLDGDTDMQPDLVWIKNRDQTDSHCLFDSVRGATEVLHGETSAVEATDADTLTSFDSDGFTLGADVKVNTDTEAYVAWCWKESATSGFDIVSYTGNDTARTISHSLSAVPKMMIFKNTGSSSSEWPVYHGANTSAPATDRLFLSGTHATGDNSTFFNDTAPTSSVFSVGDSSDVNEASEITISYLFAEKQGYSKFGSYAGNANANGVFIYTGFKPAFFICKRADATVVNSWNIFDNKRNTYNETSCFLEADTTDAEDCASGGIDFLSNGIKIKTASARFNQSSSSYVYIAFAEAPFVNSNGVPCNAR